jgi:hypothetical protein
MRIVAIPATPGATLAKYDCGQTTGKIATAQWGKAADLQV